MRIAQIAPAVEAVPPERYGGTERVIAVLVEELVRRGHEVTLFASGDSQTSARLVPVVPRGLRLAGVRDPMPAALLALGLAYDRAAQFDVIHSHLDFPTLPFAHRSPTPSVITCHGRLDLLHTHAIFEAFRGAHLVSISDNQRRLLPHWHWAGTVYNGIDLANFTFHPRPASTSPSWAASPRRRASRTPSPSPPSPACPLRSPPRWTPPTPPTTAT
jgi:glycosyltransferase involved in cell wall biosynthesis